MYGNEAFVNRSISAPPSLWEEVDELAGRLGRDRSTTVRLLIRHALQADEADLIPPPPSFGDTDPLAAIEAISPAEVQKITLGKT